MQLIHDAGAVYPEAAKAQGVEVPTGRTGPLARRGASW